MRSQDLRCPGSLAAESTAPDKMWNSTKSNPLCHSLPTLPPSKEKVACEGQALRVMKDITRALVTPPPVHPLSHSCLL